MSEPKHTPTRLAHEPRDGYYPGEAARRVEDLLARVRELEEALMAISRGLTNGQKERGETFQTIARAALARK